ncbi:N-acyl-D-amino-acid deacylase family protein [Candidatus Cetobacterium colombiensis]|uniref:Amidohydrolase family protein n=1 Tax=Candidatus Cetobacterium colombiensis TaxID=3073100 RepID=A0ABU4W9D9_9FUSO|nr:amidohydrolase family protein [Candidatus Cetobacterium colombiensis]MDX8336149.1 amidohydrolase family protein [Candidatus Cetobacterium colombiensis]
MKFIFDLVIVNGIVVYGSLTSKEIINIGIIKDKIHTISKNKLYGKKIINAKNLYVSPGFIDIHSHSDISGFISENCESKLYQGVTTEINGNCGIGIFPWSEIYKNQLKTYIQSHSDINYYSIDFNQTKSFSNLKSYLTKRKLPTNQGYLVGAGCLRIAIMGFKSTPATSLEINKMKLLLEKQLKEGALGISFGLIYQPGNFMSKIEIEELLKVIKEYDKIASFHIRDEIIEIEKSIKEIIDYGRKTKAKVNISHLKIMNKNNWGKSKNILNLLEEAKHKNISITFDQYPYEATATNLLVLIPPNFFNGDIDEFIKNIPIFLQDIIPFIKNNIEKRGGSKNIFISNTFLKETHLNGKSLEEISKYLNLNEEETILYIIKKSRAKAQGIYFSMNLNDLIEFFNSDLGIIASDGNSFPIKILLNIGTPHPRSFGTFPKFISMTKNYFQIEKIINKITKKPADLMNLKNRGEIKNGYFADIVIFDLKNIRDCSTFTNPFQISKGIEYVIVNGDIIIKNKKFIPTKNGKILT